MQLQLPLTIGIEEEYMLVHPETGCLIQAAPESLHLSLQSKLGSQVSREFLQCQVEIGTKVCKNIKQAKEDLAWLRSTIAAVATEHGLAMISASTHPFAEAQKQAVTHKARYAALTEDLQGVVRRLLISGMHVHVGIEDNDASVDLMGQAAYILPHLLALSTSSPFWQGENSGLKSYRISVWDEIPRTGLPQYFASYSEYQRHIQILVEAGIIEDASKIWWDLRPSCHFPTLEMRISDACTTLDDSICIAALYVCWLRMLHRLRMKNQRWRRYSPMLLQENRWRAHRYGIDEGLIDFGRGEIIPYPQLLDEMMEIIEDDAKALDCRQEIEHAYTILDRGTSAHRQLAIYNKSINNGDEPNKALIKVVDWLREETLNF